MPNITDYVRWYKDIGFDVKPFCDVDNIVLCQLSYLDLKPVLGEDYTDDSDALTLTECIRRLRQMGIPIRKQAPDDSKRFEALVSACVASKRFGTLKITRFKDVYSVMNCWGANHGAISYGHIGADLITLCSMLRIPVCMHNVPDDQIFRPAAWNAFGMDKEGADFRACENFGPTYK